MAYLGAHAQDAPWTQMTELSDATTVVDSVTVGATVPYFVMPDPVLNDAFNAAYDSTADNAGNNLESEWTWFKGAGALTGGIVFPVIDGTAPFVKVTWTGTAGDSDTLWVREDTDMGGTGTMCEGDSSWVEVFLVDQPAFTVRAAGTNEIYRCGEVVEDVTLDEIVDNSLSGSQFYFDYDLTIDSLNSALVPLAPVVSSDLNQIEKVNYSFGADISMISNYSFELKDGYITRYTFTLNGMNDHISRKSDFLALIDKSGAADAEYTYYAPETGGGEETTIVYYIFPRPVTGSIYYIPNDFNK